MTRILLEYLLPLLAPTILYFLWMRFAANPQQQRETPWLWLAAAGLVLTVVMLAAFELGGGNKNDLYVPPHIENGTLVPGHFVPRNSPP